MLVKDKFSWLSCSPDGLIMNEDEPSNFGLLEIKCLYRCRDDETIDFAKCKDFLDKDGNLREKHVYYMQVFTFTKGDCDNNDSSSDNCRN